VFSTHCIQLTALLYIHFSYDKQRYRAFRRVRGDGNCFYRSFLFALLEHLVATLGVSEAAATAEIDRLTGVITSSKDALISVGYQEIVFDSFQEALLEMLASLKGKTLADLEQEFQVEDGISIHLVWFCRLLTAAYLKMHADR
jgi:ubiquitin thioesterase protein OTUB1